MPTITDPVSPLPPSRPGWQTSEFYVATVTAICGLMITLGIGGMDTTHANQLIDGVKSVVGGIVTIVSVATYIWSRVKAKGN